MVIVVHCEPVALVPSLLSALILASYFRISAYARKISLRTGVNTLTGEGLAKPLKDASNIASGRFTSRQSGAPSLFHFTT